MALPRPWRLKLSGFRRPSEESPDFSSGLLSRNWRVDRKGPPEWFERVGDGGFHTEPESDTSDGTGEGGPPYEGECGDSKPDDKTW